MDFQHHRKLLSESFIPPFCEPICNITAYCEPACLTYCPTNCSCAKKCLSVMFYDNPATSPPMYQEDSKKSNRAPKLFVTSVVVLCAVFLVVFFCAMYYRFYSNRRTHQQSNQTNDTFLDEDHHGPILDHPIWYIRTTGLQPSIISSITVLKYKKGEGVVDGTDCSVCLNEFQEDETVRLLPKCSHAFHVSCIDTWLRSHTNCPLCRAPIITSSTIRATTPFQTSVVNSGSVEENQAEFADNTGESNDREIDHGANELRVAEEEGETTVQSEMNIVVEMYPRRSLSLDPLSAAKINTNLRNGFHLENDGKINGVEEGNAPTSSGRSHSFAGKARLKGSSSMSRTSSNLSGSMKRSFSWSGIILSSRHSRSQKTKAAVRSF